MKVRVQAGSSRRRGGALLLSLIAVMLIAGLGAAMIEMHMATTRKQSLSLDGKRAFYIAEAGIAEAFIAIAQGKSGNVGDENIPAAFAGGVYWVEAEETTDGIITLESHGLFGAGRASIGNVLQRVVNPVSSLGVFGDLEMEVGAGSILDGYDSRDGAWESQVDSSLPVTATGFGARVQGNADVDIDGSAESTTFVYGDVHSGPNGGVVTGASVVVSGSTAPGESTTILPPIEVPELDSTGNLVHTGATPHVVPQGEVRFDNIRVGSGSEIRIQGPATVVVARLTVDSGGALVIDNTSGPVSLFCTHELQLEESSSLLTTSTNPEDAAILISSVARDEDEFSTGDGGPGSTTAIFQEEEGGGPSFSGSSGDPQFEFVGAGPVSIQANGTYYGMIYAPLVDLEIPSTLRIYGAVSARKIRLAEGSRVSFDEALTSAGVGSLGIPSFVAWRVIAIPDVPLARSRRDPLITLSLAGVAPIRTSVAHREQDIEITYYDTDDELQTFNGDASTFDWNSVESIVTVEWIGSGIVQQGDVGNPLIFGNGMNTLETETAIAEMIDNPVISDADLEAYLVAHAPLSTANLLRVINRSPPFALPVLRDIMVANSPLSQPVLVELRSLLGPGDMSAVDAVQ